jgi:hypothetical protein
MGTSEDREAILMDAVITTVDVTASSSAICADHLAWAEERLGPKPGKWDGYDDIGDDIARKQLWSKVGYIHGLSAEAGRNIVAIGQTLREMKEMLPHGQFMACVKAEFQWTQRWATQLMQVAERFSNWNSSSNLPSSAKVLALLASSGADDATVQQAADEHWTVAEAKQRLRKRTARSARQPQAAEALALSIIRKGEVERLRQALALAERATAVTDEQVMAEQRLRELGKVRFIAGAEADFHRMKDGSWVRLPHAGAVDAVVLSETVCDIEASPSPEPEQSPARAWEAAPLLNLEAAAKRLQCTRSTLVAYLSRSGGMIVRNGYKVAREGRGMVRLTPVVQ